MTLRDSDRIVMVSLEIKRAKSCFDDCLLMVEHNRWSGAAGRMYYAVFHAVCALLIHDGHQVKTHKGAGVMLSQHYIHTGTLPSHFGDLFYELETIRERSDYDCFYNVSETDVVQFIKPAKEMIASIEKMVKQ